MRYLLGLQSTRFTHERSTSNIHRLVHSSISFFEKFSDSANLGFYIRNINFVVRNFSWKIVIIIRTFRPGTEKLVFIPQLANFRVAHYIFIIFKRVAKNRADKKIKSTN